MLSGGRVPVRLYHEPDGSSERASIASSTHRFDQRAHALKIRGRIDARPRPLARFRDVDAPAVV